MSMPVTYSKLFKRGRIGNLEIKNRVIFAPVSTNLASVTGDFREACTTLLESPVGSRTNNC